MASINDGLYYTADQSGLIARVSPSYVNSSDSPYLDFYDSNLPNPGAYQAITEASVERFLERPRGFSQRLTTKPVELDDHNYAKVAMWAVSQMDLLEPNWRERLSSGAVANLARLEGLVNQNTRPEFVDFETLVADNKMNPGTLKVVLINNWIVANKETDGAGWKYCAQDVDDCVRQYRLHQHLSGIASYAEQSPVPEQTIRANLGLTTQEFASLKGHPFLLDEVKTTSSGLFEENLYPPQAVVAARITQLELGRLAAPLSQLASLVGAPPLEAKYVQVQAGLKPIWSLDEPQKILYKATDFFRAWKEEGRQLPGTFHAKPGLDDQSAMGLLKLDARQFNSMVQRYNLNEALCSDLTYNQHILRAAKDQDRLLEKQQGLDR